MLSIALLDAALHTLFLVFTGRFDIILLHLPAAARAHPHHGEPGAGDLDAFATVQTDNEIGELAAN